MREGEENAEAGEDDGQKDGEVKEKREGGGDKYSRRRPERGEGKQEGIDKGDDGVIRIRKGGSG